MITPKKALILWKENDNTEVTNLKVIKESQDSNSLKEYASIGGSDPSWLQTENGLDNPMGTFLYLMTAKGFRNRKSMIQALHEFSKIKGQPWAKQLLVTLGVEPKKHHD